MNSNSHRIQDVEDKYGLYLFRMALTHLIDVGVRNFSSEAVDEMLKQLEAREAKESRMEQTPLCPLNFSAP